MKPFRTTSIPEQLADHLRREVVEGRLEGVMPGVLRLERQTGVNRKTVESALRILEADGLLVTQGAGKRRRIVAQEATRSAKPLRVAILLYEPEERLVHYIVDLVYQLAERGHRAEFSARSMLELGMNLARIARLVEQTEADAWVVLSGPQGVLEWFASRPTPAFALFGRLKEVRLAGTKPNKAGALHALMERLVSLEHRRIVMLAREDRRKPEPGFFERLFLEKLESCGIRTSAYNLPDWEDSPEDLGGILSSLFRHSPPTAMIIEDELLYFAVQQHLARRGILAPDHVSLACADANPSFDWCRPTIAHIAWDSHTVVRRVVKWADNISRGREDRRKTTSPARFVDGGSIGPAKGR